MRFWRYRRAATVFRCRFSAAAASAAGGGAGEGREVGRGEAVTVGPEKNEGSGERVTGGQGSSPSPAPAKAWKSTVALEYEAEADGSVGYKDANASWTAGCLTVKLVVWKRIEASGIVCHGELHKRFSLSRVTMTFVDTNLCPDVPGGESTDCAQVRLLRQGKVRLLRRKPIAARVGSARR